MEGVRNGRTYTVHIAAYVLGKGANFKEIVSFNVVSSFIGRYEKMIPCTHDLIFLFLVFF
jgi:hypothetical protein